MYCFYDDDLKTETINISQQEYFVSLKGIPIHTIVGPGLAVALFDPIIKTGGLINLNICAMSQKSENNITTLIEAMVKTGCKKGRLQAKLIGAGNLKDSQREHDNAAALLEYARNFLAEQNIEIVTENTGGTIGRKIFLKPDTFKILLKKFNADNIKLNQELEQSAGRNRHKDIEKDIRRKPLFAAKLSKRRSTG